MNQFRFLAAVTKDKLTEGKREPEVADLTRIAETYGSQSRTICYNL